MPRGLAAGGGTPCAADGGNAQTVTKTLPLRETDRPTATIQVMATDCSRIGPPHALTASMAAVGRPPVRSEGLIGVLIPLG